MENKRMSELPVATAISDDDYTIIVQGGVNKRVNRGIFKQKEYSNLDNRPYINSNYSSSLVPTLELLQGTIQFHKISKTGKYGDLLDLPYIPVKLSDLTNDGFYVQDQYYVHTDNNLTSGLIDRINTAIQTIKVNNNLLTPNASQEVNIIIPTKLSDLTNDGNFVQDENYVHTDNNFNTDMKNSYDNLVVNVNQPVNTTNKIATMNDLAAIDNGYWVIIDIYKDILFDGVINSVESVPTSGTYAVLEVKNNILVVNKYVNGVSDNVDIPFKEGYFVFVKGTDKEIIYYIKENVWSKLNTDLGNYYNKQDTDNKFVAKETGKSLMTDTERTKLNGISTGANKVEKSNTNGNIKIDGTEVTVYTKPDLTSSEVITALGYTPVNVTTLTNDYYNKQNSDNRYVQKETGKSLISTTEITKLSGVSEGANKVEHSNTNGNILIDGTETVVYVLSKGAVIEALGYTPVEASGDLSDYYDKKQADNRFVQKENGKELISTTEITRLLGMSTGANKVEKSNTNGNIKIDGVETTVYKKTDLTSSEIITALGFTPANVTVLDDYYNKQTSDNRYVQKETGKSLISDTKITKLDGISTGANKVEKSNTNGNIKIDGVETTVYTKPTLTKSEVTNALGYTPPTSSVVTTSANGLMSIDMLTKLNGISTGANKVQKSNTNGNILIDGTEVTVYTKPELTKTDVVTALGYTPPTKDTNTTYDVVTASANGLMSTDMLAKLNGITADADSVSFTRNLTSGTKVGTITINGTATDLYAPTNTDTHDTSHLYVGTSSGNTNAATSNGNTYLMVLDNTTVRDRRLIKGTGGTTVTSDANGNITINSPSSSEPTTIYADFIGNWVWYSDGTNLTQAEGLTMEIYDKMKPGVILEYTPMYSYSTTVYALILYQESYYSYKPEGGRYYVRNYVILNSYGYTETYTFSADALSGDENVYKGSNLGDVSSGGGAVACFTGDTLIDTKNGKTKISDVKEGDLILSYNENNRLMQYKEVTKIYSHKVNQIFYITIKGKTIKTTWSHPFYIIGKGMVKASNLKQGDIVMTNDNKRLYIENIQVEKIEEKVYEILVKDNRNYFVGEDSILVGCEDIDEF